MQKKSYPSKLSLIIIEASNYRGVKLSRRQTPRSGHECSRQGGWEFPIRSRAHRWHTLWLHAWMQHQRRHINCMPVTREIICRPKYTVCGLCRSGKSIRSCTQTCHLVGLSKVRCWGVASTTQTEHAWKCQRQGACWLQPEWRVQYESGCSPRFLLQAPTVYHGSGSHPLRVSYRMSLGKPVCRWPGHDHWRDCKRSWSSGRLI